MWQSQANPPVPHSSAKYWANVGDILARSNFSNPAVNSRLMPDNVGVPAHWQPPTTRRSGDVTGAQA